MTRKSRDEQMAAAQQAFEETKQLVEQPAEWVMNSHKHEVIKGNMSRAAVWVESPAYVQVLALGTKRFKQVDRQRGGAGGKIAWVRAAYNRVTTEVAIWPTHDELEEDKIEVIQNGPHLYINLISLLGPEGLTVEKGYKTKHALTPGNGPKGKAVTFKLSDVLERSSTSKARKRKQTQAE